MLTHWGRRGCPLAGLEGHGGVRGTKPWPGLDEGWVPAEYHGDYDIGLVSLDVRYQIEIRSSQQGWNTNLQSQQMNLSLLQMFSHFGTKLHQMP